MIVRAAHAINDGELPPTRSRGRTTCATSSSSQRDGARRRSSTRSCALAATACPRTTASTRAADVLGARADAPRAASGIDALNDELRARAEPGRRADRGHAAARRRQVIQTRNYHERDLMNGERGVLVHHDDDRDRVHSRRRGRPPPDAARRRARHAAPRLRDRASTRRRARRPARSSCRSPRATG